MDLKQFQRTRLLQQEESRTDRIYTFFIVEKCMRRQFLKIEYIISKLYNSNSIIGPYDTCQNCSFEVIVSAQNEDVHTCMEDVQNSRVGGGGSGRCRPPVVLWLNDGRSHAWT